MIDHLHHLVASCQLAEVDGQTTVQVYASFVVSASSPLRKPVEQAIYVEVLYTRKPRHLTD